MKLPELATHYRAAQLFAHAAHNNVKGPSFFSDHEQLGEWYGEYEKAYDYIVEQAIQLGEKIDLAEIGTDAAAEAAGYDDSADAEMLFRAIRTIETDLRTCLKECLGYYSAPGLQNLLQGFATDSDHRLYLLQGRIA